MIPALQCHWLRKVFGVLGMLCVLLVALPAEAKQKPVRYSKFSVGSDLMQVRWNGSKLMVRLKPQQGEGIYR
ncbi:MAG TPA: hypothetical protein EYM25_08715, partial [Deltaproteobacteria bacterium]|nr:hypothetical protein [Deltaproteobacteria bacterium]